MSAEYLPESLTRLFDQHPAAIRTLLFQHEPLNPKQFGHLEIETKHGHVVLIDHATGELYTNPPVPPGAGISRQQRDLTSFLPGAFNGRPVIQTITAMTTAEALSGYHFTLSTGYGFSFTLDPSSPLLLADDF